MFHILDPYTVAGGGGEPATFWNPLTAFGSTLSNDNYTVDVNSHGTDGIIPAGEIENHLIFGSGLYYWEVDVELCTATGVTPHLTFGIQQNLEGLAVLAHTFSALNMYSPSSTIPNQFFWNSNSSGAIVGEHGTGLTVTTTGVTGFSTGDRLMFAFNRDTGKLWIGKNGTWFNSGDPAAGTNPQCTGFDTTQHGGPFVWNFCWGCSAIDYSATPITFSGAFGNSQVPQLYSPPVGFTSVLPPSDADFLTGWNARLCTAPDSTGWQFVGSTLLLGQWLTNGSIFVPNSNIRGSSSARMLPGGKYYWEHGCNANSTTLHFGLRLITDALNSNETQGTCCLWEGDGTIYVGASAISSDATGVASFTVIPTDRLMFAFDEAVGKMWLGKNGTWFNSGNPATGVNPQFSSIPTGNTWVTSAWIGSGSKSCALFDTGGHSYAPPTGFSDGIPLSVAAV
jgi:hypothetical protein